MLRLRLRPRLALRIYLAGLAQIGAVVLGFGLILHLETHSERRRLLDAQSAVEILAQKLSRPAELTAELRRVEHDLEAFVVIYDAEGHLLATNYHGDDFPQSAPPLGHFIAPPPIAGPGGPSHGPRPHDLGFPAFGPPGPPRLALVLPLRLSDGTLGRALFVQGKPPAISRNGLSVLALVLAVVGVASLLTARMLAGPLTRLSEAARAFGSGQLDARAGLLQRDEIGEVGAAFDEMADRVKALLRAERELLANVSHELRTPLARIRVAVDLASEGDAQTARESLLEIAEDLSELERLIQDVLATARLDLSDGTSGPLPVRRVAVDVALLLNHAASRFRQAHAVRPLTVEMPSPLPDLEGDPVLLRRVIENLLENGHKYSKAPTDPLTLSAASEGTALRIDVVDHGIGITPEDLPHVFRPFFRADRSRSRATGSLGLGLALSRRIVEAHGGTIALESQVGEGTRTLVRIPAKNAQTC